MALSFGLGLHTFGDITVGSDGLLLSHTQVIRNMIEEGVLADELGVDSWVLVSTTAPNLPCRLPKSCSRSSLDALGAFASAPQRQSAAENFGRFVWRT
jgi:hypothetical protein